MHTLLQTSDKRFAVRSLISLCLMEGNPPFGQDKACSTEKLVPQSQLVGARFGMVSYGCHPRTVKTGKGSRDKFYQAFLSLSLTFNFFFSSRIILGEGEREAWGRG